MQLIARANSKMADENNTIITGSDNAVLPLVSVVMSCFREPLNWLSECIESVLAQTMADFEFIIIIDDPENLLLIDKVLVLCCTGSSD